MAGRRLYDIFKYGGDSWDVLNAAGTTICLHCYRVETGMAQCGRCGVYMHGRCAKDAGDACPLCEPERLYGP